MPSAYYVSDAVPHVWRLGREASLAGFHRLCWLRAGVLLQHVPGACRHSGDDYPNFYRPSSPCFLGGSACSLAAVAFGAPQHAGVLVHLLSSSRRTRQMPAAEQLSDPSACAWQCRSAELFLLAHASLEPAGQGLRLVPNGIRMFARDVLGRPGAYRWKSMRQARPHCHADIDTMRKLIAVTMNVYIPLEQWRAMLDRVSALKGQRPGRGAAADTVIEVPDSEDDQAWASQTASSQQPTRKPVAK